MSRQAWPLAIVLALAPLPAFAAPADGSYQQRVLSVVEFPDDPYSGMLKRTLSADTRYVVLPTAASRSQSPSTMIALVAANARGAGQAGAPAYAFVPRHHLGPIRANIPEVEGERDDRSKRGDDVITVRAHLRCPFTYTVDLYEVASSRLLKSFVLEEDLDRVVEYSYGRNENPGSVTAKAVILGATVASELGRPPSQAFATQADHAMASFANTIGNDLRAMAEFKLQAGITALSGERDRVTFNMGRALGLKPDDWFTVLHGGRQVGIVKVRALNGTTSEAEPVFLDSPLSLGDRVAEYPKSNMWHGAKGGVLALSTGVMGVAGYGFQWDVAPAFSGSELYLTSDLGILLGAQGTGFDAQMGLTKKNFMRRWGWSYGFKVGALMLPALTQSAGVPCGSLVAGLDCFLTPEIAWTNELALEGVWPFATLANPTKVTYAFGPLLRTGFTLVF